MVQHIVFWNLKEGVDRDAVYTQLVGVFDAFSKDVPGMRSLKLYKSFGGYDICLISFHQDRAALEAYQNFPAHQDAKKIVASYRSERAACDFEIDEE